MILTTAPLTKCPAIRIIRHNVQYVAYVLFRFLDTHVMSSSPSANYYKPTDEPEPWDLTQLNIEASVMCLVSKVKFLCGRCGSPAVRLRYTHLIFFSIEAYKKSKTTI